MHFELGDGRTFKGKKADPVDPNGFYWTSMDPDGSWDPLFPLGNTVLFARDNVVFLIHNNEVLFLKQIP
jgi:hypothetical protein